jgi:hypothetical protein
VPVPPRTSLTRRDALRLGVLAAAGATLTACTTASNDGSPTTASPGGPEDPDRGLRAELAASEQALSDLYAEVAPTLPVVLATRITALGSRHDAYRAAVDPAGATAPAAGSSPGSITAAASASPARTSGDVAFALRRLRTAETAAAAARATQSARATDAELARVVVLTGAGAAGAAEVLRRVRG